MIDQRRALNDGSNRWHASDKGVIHVAADERGSRCRPTPDENRFDVEALRGKKPEVLADDQRQNSIKGRCLISEGYRLSRDPSRTK